MKRYALHLLALLAFATTPSVFHAQPSSMPQRNEIVAINPDDIDSRLEVFSTVVDNERAYYLSVGHLGIGNQTVQFNIDPIFELFIPLGANLEETIATLQTIQSLYKEPAKATMTTDGCLNFAFPNQDLETVTLTHFKSALSNFLQVSVQREDYIRATTISKSDFNMLLRGVKMYRSIHPKE